MKALTIQLQPDRSPKLDVRGAVTQFRSLAGRSLLSEGEDQEGYVNIRFESDDLKSLWALIQNQLRTDAQLAHAAIVVCQGNHGWVDYLLLHHFDTTLLRDELKD